MTRFSVFILGAGFYLLLTAIVAGNVLAMVCGGCILAGALALDYLGSGRYVVQVPEVADDR